MCVYVLSCPDRLDNAANLTSILNRSVPDNKVLERKFVSKRNRLFGASLQTRVVRQVFPSTLGAGLKVDDRNANIVRSVMDKKVNH
jgi:hypothetical protein